MADPFAAVIAELDYLLEKPARESKGGRIHYECTDVDRERWARLRAIVFAHAAKELTP